MSPVRTVLGDVTANHLGLTYLHEHLIIDHPLVADRFPHISLPSVDEAVGEVHRCAATGVKSMVDAMPCASGRNVSKLAEVSRRTGVNIVAATGLHTAKYYAGALWATALAPEELADLFVADVLEGIDRYDYTGPVVDRTRHRAGIVKLATSGERPTASERRLIEAVAMAHQRTGAPILTHCEDGKGGLAQIEALTGLGVDPARVVLSHTDKVVDAGYHHELLSAGANLEYDQLLRQEPDPGQGTVWLLSQMIEAGHLSRLMLGTDGARRSLWAELGGAPGLARLATVLDSYYDQSIRHALFVTNPAAFLTS